MRQDLFALLQQHGQLHLLDYYNKLDDAGKAAMEDQISMIDWNYLRTVENHTAPERGVITPLTETVSTADIREREVEYREKGLAAIRAGKVGAMLLAGGMGTRLGCSGPKGVVDIGLTHPLFIFECLFRNTLEVVREAGAWIPFFIMTSDKNHQETITFLKEHNYFGYNEEYIYFFRQDMAPCIDYEHRLLMEGPGQLAISPNGNGGWYSSFARAGLAEKAKAMGVEWLNCFAVDNVLQRICDPLFVGAVICSGCVSGSKVVRKADPKEKVGVLCLEDGRPSIVEYYELTDEMAYAKNEKGEYSYTFGVILHYLFRADKLDEIANTSLPMHIVEKKIPYMDVDGTMHHPAAPNGYKFETLILDMVHMMDNCLAYEVIREHEFAPIKNATGVDSMESARALLEKNGIRL